MSSSTISPDQYINQLKAQIKSSINQSNSSSSAASAASASQQQSSWMNPLSSLLSFNRLTSSSSSHHHNQDQQFSLDIDPHHLSYLLIRFQEIGLDIGRLDLKILKRNIKPYDPTDWMIGLNNNEPSNNDQSGFGGDSKGLNLFSGLSIGPSSWFSASSNQSSHEPDQVSQTDKIKFIYSSFTRLSNLTLTPSSSPDTTKTAPPSLLPNQPMQLVQGFTDLPNQTFIPLQCFKSITKLILRDLDPRMFTGWNRLSQNLRVLEIFQSGIQDLESFFIDCVLDDIDREKKEEEELKTDSNLITATTNDLKEETDSSFEPVLDEDLETSTAKTEEPESDETSDNKKDDESSLPIEFPRHSWNFLRHLSLSNNSLTFIPSNPLKALVSLISFDLSSNLLVCIPNGLKFLISLKFLNLSNNLIDSVLGIYQSLGNISSLDLSKNRLSSLCGVERLYSLEKLNIKNNLISDITELSRLGPLPNLRHLWISENPFCKIVKNYRIQIFNYFGNEGRDIDQSYNKKNRTGDYDYDECFDDDNGIELVLDNFKNSFNEKRFIIKKRLKPKQAINLGIGNSNNNNNKFQSLNRSISVGDYEQIQQKKKTVIRSSPQPNRRRTNNNTSNHRFSHYIPQSNQNNLMINNQGSNISSNSEQQNIADDDQIQNNNQVNHNHNHHRRKRIIDLKAKNNSSSNRSTGEDSEESLKKFSRFNNPRSISSSSSSSIIGPSTTTTTTKLRSFSPSSNSKLLKKDPLRSSLSKMGGEQEAGEDREDLKEEEEDGDRDERDRNSERTKKDSKFKSGRSRRGSEREGEGLLGLEDRKGGLEFRRRIEALRDEVGESWLKVLGESVEFGNDQSTT